jgi:hypothetical protein
MWQRLIGEPRGEMRAGFAEVDGHFDDVYKRFDRLETEYQVIVAGLKRLEERMDPVESRPKE